MKRDWDYIRKLLTDVEEDRDVLADMPTKPEWPDDLSEQQFNEIYKKYKEADDRICGHLELLTQNGYIKGLKVEQGASGEWLCSVYSPRLTMAGHDLLDTMRSDGMWEKIKKTAKDKGVELTFDGIKIIGGALLKQLFP